MTMLVTMCLSVFVDRIPPSHGCLVGRYCGMLGLFWTCLAFFLASV